MDSKSLCSKQIDDMRDKSWILLDSSAISNEGASPSSCVSYVCDPNCRPYRYIIALLVGMIEGILTYCSDFPAGIQSTMIKVMKLDNTQYNLIYSACTWPDIVMSILGTVIIDNYLGMRKGLVIFTSIILTGQVIVSIGAFTDSFYVMLVGRLLIGCGFGTTTSLVVAFDILWFAGKEVTFVFSLSQSLHHLCASLALFTPQFTYDALGKFAVLPSNKHGITQLLCTLICLLAVILAITVAFLDRRGAKIIGRKPFPKRNINFHALLSFPMSYWIIGLICSLYFGVIVGGFTPNAPEFFVSRFGYSMKVANIVNSLSYLTVAAATPFFSILVDITGYNLVWGFLGIFTAIVSNSLYVIGTADNKFIPYLSAVICSISFSFFGSAMWVTVGYLIPKHQLTTALGVLMSMYAIYSGAIGLSTGIIVDHIGYLILEIFFLSLLILVLLADIFLFLLEFCPGEKRILNVTGKSRMKS